MKIEIVNTLAEDDWRRFVDQHPAGNIFHTPEMFEVYASAKNHQPFLWAAVDKAGQPLALLLPVQVNVLGGIFRKLTTRSVVYGSALCEPNEGGREALAFLLKTYTREVNGTPLFTELRNLSNLEDIQPVMSEQGFIFEDHLNYLIDLDLPTETIFQNIGKRTRKNIRRGLNRGEVVIEEVKEREKVHICYDLLQKTYHSAEVPLADYALFESAFNVLFKKGMIRFILAYVDGAPVATSIELIYKEILYGWYGGVDRNYSKFMPNELLTWNILEWGANQGHRVYDFGGAGKPNEEYGVRDFKAKFGGTLVCFGRNTFIHAPFRLWLSTLGYAILRRFIS
jgi:CelD/BcsL family acetyltransferase involved in cellulose biosynthesis